MKLGIKILIHNKDDIEFVTELPCLLGHPVLTNDKEFFFFSIAWSKYFLSQRKKKVRQFWVQLSKWNLNEIQWISGNFESTQKADNNLRMPGL